MRLLSEKRQTKERRQFPGCFIWVSFGSKTVCCEKTQKASSKAVLPKNGREGDVLAAPMNFDHGLHPSLAILIMHLLE